MVLLAASFTRPSSQRFRDLSSRSSCNAHGDNAATDYPNTRIARTVEEVFSDPAIDLIVVGTPNETHFELAKAALEAGKHVVIDKPFAASSAQARALISLAAEQGKVLAPFHNRRYDSDFVTLRKLVAEGTLGRITQVIFAL